MPNDLTVLNRPSLLPKLDRIGIQMLERPGLDNEAASAVSPRNRGHLPRQVTLGRPGGLATRGIVETSSHLLDCACVMRPLHGGAEAPLHCASAPQNRRPPAQGCDP